MGTSWQFLVRWFTDFPDAQFVKFVDSTLLTNSFLTLPGNDRKGNTTNKSKIE